MVMRNSRQNNDFSLLNKFYSMYGVLCDNSIRTLAFMRLSRETNYFFAIIMSSVIVEVPSLLFFLCNKIEIYCTIVLFTLVYLKDKLIAIKICLLFDCFMILRFSILRNQKSTSQFRLLSKDNCYYIALCRVFYQEYIEIRNKPS